MRQGTGRERGMSRDEDLRGDRAQRSGPPEADKDLETDIEDELRASGRSHFMPREGLVGAHEARRQGLAGNLEDGLAEPVGRGSAVAPTARAEERERLRHDLQRDMGVSPAGENGSLRQRRRPGVQRSQLDGALREADQHMTEEVLFEEQKAMEAEQGIGEASQTQRVTAWLRNNQRTVALVGGAAVVAAICLTAAARSRA